MSDELLIHLGGSNRKLDRQIKAFKAAGISLTFMGSTPGKHWSNVSELMPDTPEARALLKNVGGSISRDQWQRIEE